MFSQITSFTIRTDLRRVHGIKTHRDAAAFPVGTSSAGLNSARTWCTSEHGLCPPAVVIDLAPQIFSVGHGLLADPRGIPSRAGRHPPLTVGTERA
jgi:hypothetical protein